jgi:hypothetical protein
MADNDKSVITEREIREAELQMTGRPPASPTGFIGFVPAAPAGPGAGGSPAGTAPPRSAEPNLADD